MRVAPDRSTVAARPAWRRRAGLVALTLAATAACRMPYLPPLTKAPASAIADLADINGRVVGRAVLIEEGGGVRVLLDVAGVTPGSKGVHLHEVGRCDPPSFESAGAHFNPGKAEHGSANPRGPHAGDLPNIVVDSTGRGHLEVTVPRVSLSKAATTLLGPNGSALVLHEGPDDLRSDPAGNSGARIACGVIRRAG